MKKSVLKEIIRKLYEEEISTGSGGQDAGKLELVNTSVEEAMEFAKNLGFNLKTDLPNFGKNYRYAQKLASLGKTKRRDMPVINDEDVKVLQQRLKDGKIDIFEPLAPTTKAGNPFPQGLQGFEAKDFLERGLKDGSKPDDIIQISIRQVPVGKLKPIQKQIYVDKSLEATKKFGIDVTKNFITKKSFFIISDDNFIIDGHHRFLSGILISPSLKVNTLSIDLPIQLLLPLSLSYGDAIGNKRNN